MDFSSMTSNDVYVALNTSIHFSGIGNDASFGTYRVTLRYTWWRWMTFPEMDQKSPFASPSHGVESWSGVEEDPSDSPRRLSRSSPRSGRSRIKASRIFDCSICDREMKFPLFCGVNTSFALSLFAWISDASISSNSSTSATIMSPFQILPVYNT